MKAANIGSRLTRNSYPGSRRSSENQMSCVEEMPAGWSLIEATKMICANELRTKTTHEI